MSQLNNLNEDTAIVVLKGFEESKTENEQSLSPQFEELILSSVIKKLIMEDIAKGIAQGYKQPFIVLAPNSYLSKKSKYLTYPILFMGSYLYFIGQIKKVIVLETN